MIVKDIRMVVKPLGKTKFYGRDVRTEELPFPMGWYNYIYILRNSPLGKVAIYVGKGKNARANEHAKPHSKNASEKIQAAIKYYGLAAFKVMIVASSDDEDEAYDNERAIVARCRAKGYFTFNENGGGRGGYLPSARTRKRMSKFHKNQDREEYQAWIKLNNEIKMDMNEFAIREEGNDNPDDWLGCRCNLCHHWFIYRGPLAVEPVRRYTPGVTKIGNRLYANCCVEGKGLYLTDGKEFGESIFELIQKGDVAGAEYLAGHKNKYFLKNLNMLKSMAYSSREAAESALQDMGYVIRGSQR